MNELAARSGVHATLIDAWKGQLRAGAEAVFASRVKPSRPQGDKTAELYEQIGRLKVESGWVKKAAAFG